MTKFDELRDYYDNNSTADELKDATFESAETPTESERMTAFSVRMPVPLLEQVRKIAAERGVTTSVQIREFIEVGVTSHRRGHTAGHEPSVPVDDLLALVVRAKAEHDLSHRDVESERRLPPSSPFRGAPM